MAQMTEHFKAPEKIQLSEEERANPSDAQFKTLVMKMLQELTWYFKCITKTQAAMKVALCEIKKNLHGTNRDGKETGTQINGVDQKEERNIQPENNEETRIQKMRRGLGTSRTSLNVPTSKLYGYQKEKRKSKKLKTSLNK